MTDIYSSRSRKLEAQRCLRARFHGYHNQGTGVGRLRLAIPLATGSHTHTGLAALLQGKTADEAVALARLHYKKDIESRGLDYGENEDAFFVANEQMALTEAMVRGYAIYQLPTLLAEYEILEVERNDVELMDKGQNGQPDLYWISRADGLIREKSSGDLYVLSYKTSAMWSDKKDEENRHDDQGLSEVWAVEQRLKRGGADCAPSMAAVPPRIQGIKMEFLIKGTRNENPKGSGHYATYNHFIRAWRKLGVTPGSDEFAWRWEYPDPNAPADNPNKKKRLSPKNWKPFNVSGADDIGGVKGWINMLASGRVQPEAGNPFESMFVTPMPYYRHDEDLQDWLEQTISMERRLAQSAAIVGSDTSDLALYRSTLNDHFPQSRRACDWPSACQYKKICFDIPFGDNPVGSGLYQIRVPHNEQERKALLGK